MGARFVSLSSDMHGPSTEQHMHKSYLTTVVIPALFALPVMPLFFADAFVDAVAESGVDAVTMLLQVSVLAVCTLCTCGVC